MSQKWILYRIRIGDGWYQSQTQLKTYAKFGHVVMGQYV